MRKADGLVLAAPALALLLTSLLTSAAASVGCDGELPFEGSACRGRLEKDPSAVGAQLLSAVRTVDATLVLWRGGEPSVDAGVGPTAEGPLWLSLRNSAGWRAPMTLNSRSTGLERQALSGRDALVVVADPSAATAGFDAGLGPGRRPNARALRFDDACGEHASDPLDLDPSAQLALDPEGRAALAWAEEGAIEARVVFASGHLEAATVSRDDDAVAELRGLVAVTRGDFVLALIERERLPSSRARLLTARWHEGAWQAPLPHADGVDLAALAAMQDGGAALAWTTWDGARSELFVRRSGVGESWQAAGEASAPGGRIDELRLVASRRDGRLAAVWRNAGVLFAQLIDGSGMVANLGRLSCACELAEAALALDEAGALVIVRARAGLPAELLRFDGWAFERGVELGQAGAEVTDPLLAAAPDGRLSAVYVQLAAASAEHDDAPIDVDATPRRRIMTVELARGRPGRAVPILAR